MYMYTNIKMYTHIHTYKKCKLILKNYKKVNKVFNINTVEEKYDTNIIPRTSVKMFTNFSMDQPECFS